MRRFEDQVAIITGGGGQVGLATAIRLGQGSARIVLVEANRQRGERAADLLDAKGIEGRLLIGDVADPASAKWAVTTATLVWGRLDMVVHAAGTSDLHGKIRGSNVDALDEHYRVDVRAPLLFCQAAIPKMMEHGYGRIVTVASALGKEGRPGESVRSSTQAALIGLTKAVAMSVIDTGIRVNAVVSSDAVSQDDGSGIDRAPIDRAVTLEEIASAVCWLASEECSFTTGATFDVTGGRGTY